MVSSEDRPTREQLPHLGEVSLTETLHKVIPYDGQMNTLQIYSTSKYDRNRTEIPYLKLEIKYDDRGERPPKLAATLHRYTKTSVPELKGPYELFQQLQHLDIIDIDGFPAIIVNDQQEKKIHLISLTPEMLAQPIPGEVDEFAVVLAREKLEKDFLSDPRIKKVIDALVHEFTEKQTVFRSLDQAHEYWVAVISSALEKAGVSPELVNSISQDDELMWGIHWEMGHTLHGYLASVMTGERELWKKIEAFGGETILTGRDVVERVDAYKKSRFTELKRQEWKITTSWPDLQKDSKTGEFKLTMKEYDDSDQVGIYQDEQSGFQIAVQMAYGLRGGIGLHIITGGKNDLNQPSFFKEKVIKRAHKNGREVFQTVPIKEKDIVAVSDVEKWQVAKRVVIDKDSQALVVFDTPRGGTHCIKVKFEQEAYGYIVKIDPENDYLEGMINEINIFENSRNESITQAELELFVSQRAHEHTQRIVHRGLSEEKADREHGINRDEKQKEKTPFSSASTSPDTAGYRELYSQHFQALLVVTGEEYYLDGPEGIYTQMRNVLFGKEIIKRLKYLIDNRGKTTLKDVFSREEKLLRQAKGLPSEEKEVPILSRQEIQELDALKRKVRKKSEALYWLVHSELFSSFDVEEMLFSSDESNSLSQDIAREFIFLAGLPDRRSQLASILNTVGKSNFIKYFSIYLSIVNHLAVIRSESTSRPVLKNRWNLLNRFRQGEKEDHREALEAQLDRLSIQLQSSDGDDSDGKIPQGIIEQIIIEEQKKQEKSRY